MPLYEYECRRCHERFELLLRGSEKPVCPSCGGTKLDKQISAPAAPHVASGRATRCGAPGGAGACESSGGGCGGCPCAMGH